MTYEEYYNQWQLSTESRDMAFDEWLCLMLDRQKKMDIEKACEWLFLNVGLYVNEQGYVETYKLERDFRKANEDW